MNPFFIIWSIIFFTNAINNIYSQTNKADTALNEKTKIKFFKVSEWSPPKKASVLSAILPGAGQVYNKKYWKVPIIYGIGGFLVYNTIKQNNDYKYFKKELLNVLNGGVNQDGYSDQQLTLLKNQSKKWRDLSIAGTFLVYVLNIIDANVDAHLASFDINDDLSFKVITPFINSNFLANDNSFILCFNITVSLK